jgi:hypothetical protein
MNKKQLNEATLEERIGYVLKTTFPAFQKLKIKHQESFSIKFGHHNVSVDLHEPSKYPASAIFDILLTTEDEKTNLILLELKKEGKAITSDDIEQGLSYARLVHPMPPLTLISNGADNLFYNTYLKTKLKKDSVDIEFIQKSIDSAFSLAINDFKQSVDILLNKNPQILSQIINDISTNRFNKLIGNLSDFTRPICEDFIIKRDIVSKLKEKCGEKNLIGIIGHAFSGKTNILYDFFRSYNGKNSAIYYLDCKESNYSIFQQLSNHLTKEFKFPINKEKVREWIISSLNNLENVSFTFLLDNFGSYTSHNMQEEIVELIDLLQDSNHTVIFTIDLLNYKIIEKVKFRNYLTYFGKDSYIIEINELNIKEFEESSNNLFNVSKSFFEQGAHFSIEYRQPRILRLLAAFFANDSEKLPGGQGFKIIAIPDYELLKLFAKNNSFSYELKELYEKLTIAFITDRINNNNHLLSLASHYGGISLSTIKKIFKDNSQALLESGFVNMYNLKNGLSIIYPKIPELIAYYGVEYIASLILKDYNDKSIESVYKTFEKLCSPFLNSDIVATGVLLIIAEKGHVDLFSNLVLYMLSLKPKEEKITDGTKATMLIDGKTHVNIEFKGDGFEDGFISNFFPYLVLSQLAGYPLRLENSDGNNEYDFHLKLILELAKSPIAMVRISNFTFSNMPPIETHEIDSIGTIICDRNGIIEPLVQSIQKCFYFIPEQIEKLYEYAFDNTLFPVIWRIYLAIKEEVDTVDENISSRAKTFMDKFNKAFPDLFSKMIHENLTNKDE